MVSDYFAIQGNDLTWDDERAFFDRVTAAFAAPDGPGAHEIMRFRDEAGETNAVVVGYWTDPTANGRWFASSELSSWLASDERLSDPAIGYWRETISVPYDRHETIYSAPWYRIGLARLPDSAIVSMTTNGYFGAARDRLPISAIDPLESPLRNQPPVAKDVSSRGRRLRVMTPKICARCDPASTGRAPGRSRLTIIMKACNRNSCAEWIS
jgi:aldoxime dehydratase